MNPIRLWSQFWLTLHPRERRISAALESVATRIFHAHLAIAKARGRLAALEIEQATLLEQQRHGLGRTTGG